MQKLLTLKEMAWRIGEVHGLNRRATDVLHSKMKGLHQRGFLEAVDHGPRDAALFDVVGLCKAQLLMALSDFTDIAPMMSREPAIADLLATGIDAASRRSPRRKLRPRKVVKAQGLDAAVEGIREGQDWTFHLELWREGPSNDKSLRAWFECDDDRAELEPNKDARRILADTLASRGERRIGHSEIPLNPLLEPLLTDDQQD